MGPTGRKWAVMLLFLWTVTATAVAVVGANGNGYSPPRVPLPEVELRVMESSGPKTVPEELRVMWEQAVERNGDPLMNKWGFETAKGTWAWYIVIDNKSEPTIYIGLRSDGVVVWHYEGSRRDTDEPAVN